MTTSPRWQRAQTEHDAALEQFTAALDAIAHDTWHQEPGARQWSPAAVALHVADSYAFARDAARAGGGAMRMRATPWQAWMGRTVLFPAMLFFRKFPRGAAAPVEVRPDLAAAEHLSRGDVIARLHLIAGEAAEALHAAPPTARIAHAYFGPLTPHQLLRLLSGHTCHHARLLSER